MGENNSVFCQIIFIKRVPSSTYVLVTLFSLRDRRLQLCVVFDNLNDHLVLLRRGRKTLGQAEKVPAESQRQRTSCDSTNGKTKEKPEKDCGGIFFLIQPVTLDITGLPQSSRELISNPVYNFGLGGKQECKSQDYTKVESKAVRKQPK